MEMEGTQNSQYNSEKEKQYGGVTFLDLKTYYKTTKMKTVKYWHKDRYRAQWNRTKLETKPYIYGQLFFDNSVKTIQYGKINSLFNKWC